MGRKYTCPINALSVSAICELLFISAPSDAVVLLHELVITQDTSETSEQLPLRIFRTATDQSAKGASITPAPLEAGDAAFGGTVRSNIIAAATLATETTMLLCEAQNVLNGWHYLPAPEDRIVISPSGRLVVKLGTAPAAALPISGYAIIEEIGG
jgi:hypothetical protein